MLERYTLTSHGSLPPRYNIAHGQIAHVITAVGGEPMPMRWGLLRPWRGHGGKRGPMIYTSLLADVDAMPILRNARKKQRCAVLADGYFLWRDKQPLWIHPDPPRVIAFAGLWHTNRDDDQPSFAILEDTAPLVIDPDAWLARGELVADRSPLRTDAVSTWVNNVAHDDPKCIAKLGNPAQGTLF